jgi:sulfofructose kinase
MTSEGFRIVCVGHATRDAIALVRSHPPADGRVVAADVRHAGGGPAATAAVALARLGHAVGFAGAVGDDPAGERILQDLAAEGVDTTHVAVVPGARSAESLILVDEAGGGRSIAAYPGTAERAITASAVADALRDAAWVHTDHIGYAAVRSLVDDGRLAGGPRWSIDGGNPIPRLSLRDVDLYVPTVEALLRHTGAAAVPAGLHAARDEGARAVVASAGADGAWLLDGDGEAERIPAADVPVHSTLGAGDVFHGALLAGLLDGLPLRDAAAHGCLVAGLSCGGLDGRSAIPTRDRLAAVSSRRAGVPA